MAGSTTAIDLTTTIDGRESAFPFNAFGAVLNITVADTENRGWFRVSASETDVPADSEFSNGNWVGDTLAVANHVTTAVSLGNVDVTLGPEGGAHIIVDLIGYYF